MLQFEFKNESETLDRLDQLRALLNAPSQGHVLEFAVLRLSAILRDKEAPNLAILRDGARRLRQIAHVIDGIAASENRRSELLDFDPRTGSWQDAMDSGEPK